NLKEVEIVDAQDIGLQLARGYHSRQREPWMGLPGFVSGKSIGSLTTLLLTGGLSSSDIIFQLQAWAKYIDFGSLRNLTLAGSYQSRCGTLHGDTLEKITR